MLSALIWSSTTHAAPQEKAYAVTSRPGVELPFVMAVDEGVKDRNEVKNVLVLLSGGSGGIRPPEGSTDDVKPGDRGINLSIRGYMAEKLGVAVSVGLPTDLPKGLPLAWRETKEHVQDVSAVVEVLMKQYPAARITVLGFSNGTRSASHVGAAMSKRWGQKLQGIVLMSPSIEAFRDDWISTLKDEAKVPVLVVHHRRDSCLWYRDIEGEAKWHTLITVDDPNQPRPTVSRRDCGAGSAHQFSGREKFVYGAVVEWIRTGKVATPD